MKSTLRYAKVILTALAAMLLLGLGHAYAQSTPVTACGQVIDAPGDYHLTGNLGPCKGNGVVISASDVNFTLAGFTISGVSNPDRCDLAAAQLGIAVNSLGEAGVVSKVHITGGTVTRFGDGVNIGLATHSRVSAMSLLENCIFGIAIGGSDIQVDTSVVSGSGLDGIVISGSSTNNITITANVISGNVRDGVDISDFAAQNVIRRNILSGNGFPGSGFGVRINIGNNNAITDNAINKNLNGVLVGAGNTGSIVRGNTVNGNAHVGINVDGSSTTIKGNTARGNDLIDLQDTNGGCDANTWRHNTFATDVVASVSDGGPGTGCIR